MFEASFNALDPETLKDRDLVATGLGRGQWIDSVGRGYGYAAWIFENIAHALRK